MEKPVPLMMSSANSKVAKESIAVSIFGLGHYGPLAPSCWAWKMNEIVKE